MNMQSHSWFWKSIWTGTCTELVIRYGEIHVIQLQDIINGSCIITFHWHVWKVIPCTWMFSFWPERVSSDVSSVRIIEREEKRHQEDHMIRIIRVIKHNWYFSLKLDYMRTLSTAQKAEISHKVTRHIQCPDSYSVVDCGEVTPIRVKFNIDNTRWIISAFFLKYFTESYGLLQHMNKIKTINM